MALFNFHEGERIAWINEDDGLYQDLITGEKMEAKGVKMPGHGVYWLLKQTADHEPEEEAKPEKEQEPASKEEAESEKGPKPEKEREQEPEEETKPEKEQRPAKRQGTTKPVKKARTAGKKSRAKTREILGFRESLLFLF